MIWKVNPLLIDAYPLRLSWYGLFFAGGFLIGTYLMQWIYRREGRERAELDVLLWYVLGGTLIGMRLAHCLFYDPQFYLSHPVEILKIWKGGYASHGGAVGVLVAVYLYCRPPGRPAYLWLLDRLTIPAVLAGASIRIGNFFNSEIIGTPTDSPLGVVFARVDPLARHPVQLYEAAAYLAIFIVLLTLYRRKAPAQGVLTGLYLCLVFGARMLLEMFKTPQASYATGLPFSVGQLLSVPFVAAGSVLLVRAYRARTAGA